MSPCETDLAAGGYGGTATTPVTKSYLALMYTQACAQMTKIVALYHAEFIDQY